MLRLCTTLLTALLLLACSAPPTAPVAPASAPHPAAAVLRGVVERGELVGVSGLVHERGREVFFGAYGQADREKGLPMSRDTLVQIWSMTKPVTGVALLMLVEQGRLSLDDPLARHLPAFADLRVYAGQDAAGRPRHEPLARPITVRDLVTHMAGLADEDDSPVAAQLRQAKPLAWEHTLAQMEARLAGLPLRHQPGTAWRYGLSVDLQARLVEKVSGQRFADFLQQRIFTPLKMSRTRMRLQAGDADRAQMAALYRREGAQLHRVPEAEALGYHLRDWPLERGGSGLLSTLDDYLRFARMLLNGGELDGVRLLRPETVRLMASDLLPPGLADRSWLPGKGQVGFGVDVAVRLRPPASREEASGEVGEFFWDGGVNTLFWVDPRNQIAAVLFTQVLPFGGPPLHKAFRDAVYEHIPSARAPR